MPKKIDEAKVFSAVTEMLVVHGYQGATTKEIAKVAGVNEATLFRKYGSKAELFARAIDEQFTDAPLRVVQYSGDVEKDLRAIVEAYLETNTIHGEVIPILLATLPRHPELKDAFNVLLENIQLMIAILKRYQDNGILREESSFISLNALIGPLMTDQMFRRAELDIPVGKVSSEQYVDAFLRGRRV